MNADLAALLLILAAAPAQTLFPIFYGITSPWHKTPVGRALMTKSIGLALLIDISLVYNWLGDDYYLRDAVRLTVFAIIAAGSNMQLGAFIYEKRRGRRIS